MLGDLSLHVPMTQFYSKEKSDLLFGYGYAPAQHGNSFK